MSNSINIDNRRLPRYSTRLKVFDQETGDLIGYTEDLHLKGIKLSSDEPVQEGKEIRIWLETSSEEKNPERISLHAYRVWSAFSDTDPRYYYTGLHFIDTSEETLDSLQVIIENLKNRS